MKQKVELTNIGRAHGNWVFEARDIEGGAWGIFRLCFRDKTRKNAVYPDLVAFATYYEGIPDNASKSQPVQSMTDLCQWVERRQQWILEELQRESRKAEYTHVYNN